MQRGEFSPQSRSSQLPALTENHSLAALGSHHDKLKSDAKRQVKEMKYSLAKQKLSEVCATMNKLQMGFEAPDTRPIDGYKPERLAVQSQYRLDKESKRYVPITPI